MSHSRTKDNLSLFSIKTAHQNISNSLSWTKVVNSKYNNNSGNWFTFPSHIFWGITSQQFGQNKMGSEQ